MTNIIINQDDIGVILYWASWVIDQGITPDPELYTRLERAAK